MANDHQIPECFTADPPSLVHTSCNTPSALSKFFPYHVWFQKAAAQVRAGHGQVILIVSPLPTEAVKCQA